MTQLINIFVAAPRLFLYAAAPIALDYGIFKIASGKMWKYGGSTALGLGAVAVLSRYTPHIRVIAWIYFAYKALLFWLNIPVKEPKHHSFPWSMDDARLAALRHPTEVMLGLEKKFSELEKHLKVDYSQPWTNWKDLNEFAKIPGTVQQVREGWNQHWNDALELIKEAGNEFENLRQELWKKFDSSASDEERYQLIAEFLQKDNSLKTHSTSYSGGGLGRKFPHNLLGYYRFIRSMAYEVCYKNSKNLPDIQIYTLPFNYEEDYEFAKYEFAKEGTLQYQIRQIYNQAIEKWLPIMEYLPHDSPYRIWIQRDEMNASST